MLVRRRGERLKSTYQSCPGKLKLKSLSFSLLNIFYLHFLWHIFLLCLLNYLRFCPLPLISHPRSPDPQSPLHRWKSQSPPLDRRRPHLPFYSPSPPPYITDHFQVTILSTSSLLHHRLTQNKLQITPPYHCLQHPILFFQVNCYLLCFLAPRILLTVSDVRLYWQCWKIAFQINLL